MQFFLFYSWLKFGRMASHPFGDDEDDIDVIRLMYSHIEVIFRYYLLNHVLMHVFGIQGCCSITIALR
jgi:hypothetical protein